MKRKTPRALPVKEILQLENLMKDYDISTAFKSSMTCMCVDSNCNRMYIAGMNMNIIGRSKIRSENIILVIDLENSKIESTAIEFII